jgi:molecular chaperone DnaK (HSP70)
VSSSSIIFGIDLGTTYSAIAYVDEFGKPRVMMNRENTAVTPSVIYFENAQNVIVGQPARESGRIDPQNYVELIKRSMGDAGYKREIHGTEYRPEQLSALVLKKLKEDTEILLQVPVTDAVITVPAYFNEGQRTATRQAGAIAGLNVRGIIPEPTAAAIAYAATDGGEKTLLVYDLGGGTFDVTVMQVSGNKVHVVCVDGDHDLGGRNWDEKIAVHLAEEWKNEHGAYDDPLSDMETQQELFKQAEEAKRNLTTRKDTRIKVNHSGQSVRVELTRQRFDELTSDLLERTITLTRQAMTEAGKQGIWAVDKILLVGGSCFMPQVQERLQAEFPGVEQQLFEPEQAVAKGAAIYAASKEVETAYADAAEKFFGAGAEFGKLSEQEKEVVVAEVKKRGRLLPDTFNGAPPEIINVCTKNFGVKTLDENDRKIVDYLIRRNRRVPAEQENEYYTVDPGQPDVSIEIYEADGGSPPEDPEHPGCVPIKQFKFSLPAGTPAGYPVRVRFSLSDDGGELRVRAQDPASGREHPEQVKIYGALGPEDVDRFRSEMDGMNLN